MIRVSGLVVTFGRGTPLEKTALAGIDLAVAAGEFVSIIGSNGAGKSTLLSALAGDFPPTSGRIEIDGVDVTRQSTARRSARVARVFQDPLAGSCGTLTIDENLALAAARGRPRGVRLRPDARDGAIEALLARHARARRGEVAKDGQRLDEPIGVELLERARCDAHRRLMPRKPELDLGSERGERAIHVVAVDAVHAPRRERRPSWPGGELAEQDDAKGHVVHVRKPW